MDIVTTIDFASSGIRVLTGYYTKGSVYVLQALEGDPLPLDENGYLETAAAETSLRLLLETTRKTLGQENTGVIIAILPPDGFYSKPGSGKTVTTDANCHITAIDFANATNMVEKQTKTEGKRILYNAPYCFGDDHRVDYTSFPMGNLSDHLSISCDSLMIDEGAYHHYQKILQDLQLDIFLTIPSPFGSIFCMNVFHGPMSYLALSLERDGYSLSYVFKKRLLKSKFVRFGIKDAIEKASEMLQIPFETVDQHFALFGFEKDPGFPYQTDEEKTLEDYSNAFHMAFMPMYEDIIEFQKENKGGSEEDLPLVFYGIGKEIPDYERELSEATELSAMGFDNFFIGARSHVFLNGIGAIILSAESYQKSIADAKMRDGDQLMKNQSFSKKHQ